MLPILLTLILAVLIALNIALLGEENSRLRAELHEHESLQRELADVLFQLRQAALWMDRQMSAHAERNYINNSTNKAWASLTELLYPRRDWYQPEGAAPSEDWYERVTPKRAEKDEEA